MQQFRRVALSLVIGALAVIGLVWVLGGTALAQPEPSHAGPPSAVQSEFTSVISDAWGYLKTQQLANGGFPGWVPGEADAFTTIKVVLALAADRRPVSFLTSISGTTSLDYLETQAYTYTRDVTGTLLPGRIGMLMAAVVALDQNPFAFAEYPPGHGSAGQPIDLVEALGSTYDPATGAYSSTAASAGSLNQLWAIMGLAAAQETVPVTATSFLLGLQEADGGWGYGFGGDADTTGQALQALLASGHVFPTDDQVLAGLDFLKGQQDADGGWGYWWGSTYYPSPDTTAAVIQALAAEGFTPATESWAVAAGKHPQSALAAMQWFDGSFGGNALGTAHAIAGLAEAPLPILGRQGMAQRGLAWLAAQQNPDGGFGSPASSASGTAEIVVALGAAGVDAQTVQSNLGLSPLDFLITRVPTYNGDGGQVGRLILAAVAGGEDPRNFGGYDLVISLTQHLSPTGQFGTSNQYAHALGMLGMSAAGEAVPLTSTQWLIDQQLPEGGWGWAGAPAETDTSAAAIQALIAAGESITSTPVVSAINYLRSIQDDDAGFCYSPIYGTDSNADSTASAIQALLAAGEELEAWVKDGRTPMEALRAFQKLDGPFVYQWGGWSGPVDNLISTYHAIPALLGRELPVEPSGLAPLDPEFAGPDSDRMVAAPARAAWGDSVDVVIPFGSDLDEDGSVNLAWRELGAMAWITVTAEELHRAEGFFSATLPLTQPVAYEFRATLGDPDLVQYGSEMTGAVVLPVVVLQPHVVYLPLMLNDR